MASTVDDAITELEAALAAIEPQYEGLQDYSRTNIKDDTRTEVNGAIQVYGQRIELLKIAIAALEALKANGYPDVPTFAVSPDIMEDLQDQEATISAALAQFHSKEAQAAELKATAGTPIPKKKG